MIYAFLPAKYAIKLSEIDKNRNYMICEQTTATECYYKILYDSQNRKIDYVIGVGKISNPVKISYNSFGYLNKYVIYGDTSLPIFMYSLESGIDYYGVELSDYELEILYPIKRISLFGSILPKSYICKFETWFD